MKKTIYCFAFLFIVITNYCIGQVQAPGIQWQQFYKPPGSGAGLNDLNQTICETADGNIVILRGSIITKIDKTGQIIWEKPFSGNNNSVFKIKCNAAGELILIGATIGNNSEVTDFHGGSSDALVMKLTAEGNFVWSKCIGGSLGESGTDINITLDNQYIVAGHTNSSDGDFSINRGDRDAWVAKVSDNGELLWSKSFGGSASEQLTKCVGTSDGNVFVVCQTTSSDGDVGEPTFLRDLWVVKLNSIGDITFKKTFDGGGDDEEPGGMVRTPDGGCMIISITDRSNLPTAPGGGDIWVIKLNTSGTIDWQRAYGSSRLDWGRGINATSDGGFLLFGNIRETGGDVSGEFKGFTDAWIVKIDAAGNIIWEKNFGGSSADEFEYGIEVEDGYIVRGFTWSADGDVSSNHEGSASWFAKLGFTNTIKGSIFLDQNSNGTKDAGEEFYSNVVVQTAKGNDIRSTTAPNGIFKLEVDTGSYITSIKSALPYYTIVPVTQQSTFTNYFNTDSVSFALQPLPNKNDLQVNVVALGPARPGFPVSYKVLYKNNGTSIVSNAQLLLKPDSRLTFISASQAVSTITNDTLKWNITNLGLLDTGSVTLQFAVTRPPAVNNGDTLVSFVRIEPHQNDETPEDNTVNFKQRVTGSYDPNDKTEANAGVITPAQVSGGDYLNYLIRFQNTGTDTAFNVYVRDTLDARLDWNTLEMISASHSYNLQIADGDKLTWTFADIKLADSNINEPASHGFIAYRIKPKPIVAVGDTIHNTASIYFDFNLPVETNNAFTLVMNPSVALPVNLSSFTAKLNNSAVNVNWKTATESKVKHFEVQRSGNGVQYNTIGIVKAKNVANGSSYAFTDNNPLSGYNYYRLRIVDVDESAELSSIVIINNSTGTNIVTAVYPNPTTGKVLLRLQGQLNDNVRVQVLDHFGREMMSKAYGRQSGNQLQVPLELGKLSKGNYILRVYVGEKVYLHKLLIQ